MSSPVIDIVVRASTADAGNAFKDLAKTLVAAFTVGAIIDFGKQAVAAASDLQEAMGGVDAVFGANAKQVHEWASDTSDSIRLPQASFEKYATIIGALLKNAGVPMDELGGKTKELMTLSSDWAARFGTTTDRAMQTMTSALKGNVEMLDEYGVNLTAAEVKVEALELAQGNSTLAATEAIKTQARLNLIFEKSGDSIGAASKESGNYAAQQEALNEVFTNMQAAVGAAMLPALSAIVAKLSELMPVIQPILVAVAEFIAVLLDLPAPVYATAAAFAAWMILNSVVTAAGGFIAVLTAMKVAILAFLGSVGAVGWIILGVGAAITALSFLWSDNEEAVTSTESAVESYKSTLDATTGAVTEATRAAVAKDLADQGVLQRLEALGISSQTYLDATLGVAGASEDLAKQAEGAGKALSTQDDALKETSRMALEAGVSQDTLNEALKTNNWGEVTKGVGEYVAKLAQTDSTKAAQFQQTFATSVLNSDAALDTVQGTLDAAGAASAGFADEASNAAAAQVAMGNAATDAADPVQDLKQALDDAKDAAEATVVNQAMESMKSTAEDASAAVDFLSLTLDKMTGGTRSADAAQAAFNESILKLGAAFKVSEGEASFNRDALMAWDVAALTTTESGQKVYDALISVSEGYNDTVGAAYASAAANDVNSDAFASAQGEAQRAYDAFIASAGAMGINETEAAQLAAQLGILNAQQLDPKVFQLIAEDQQARAQVAALQAQGIDPKNIVVTANTDPATGAVTQAISVIDASGATIPVEAAVNPATSAMNAAAAAAPDATIDTNANTSKAAGDIANTAKSAPDATIKVSANTAQATSQITGVAAQAYNATIQVQANTSPAQGAITALVLEQRTKQITVTANTSSFDSTMSSITNRSYSATVNVTANTSAATAAIAAIPKSVSVPPPAPTPAPTLRLGASQQAHQVATVNWNIQVDAGINDPDSVARAINRVVLQRERRSTYATAI
jgi:hypothetical protein